MRSSKPRMGAILCLGGALLTLAMHPRPARAWGAKGHAIVAGIANVRMQSEHAKQQVADILGPQKMDEVASWLDDVRRLQPGFAPPKGHPEIAEDPDSIAFVDQFCEVKPAPEGHVVGGSAPWHFADLPLDTVSYDDPGVADKFGGQPLRENVVMRIQSCIALLQSNAPVHGAWGKRNALRTLIHLVGDIHQPLHVGSGFLDPESTDLKGFIVRNPAVISAKGLKSDLGGNDLLIPNGEKGKPLHEYWDDDLVDRDMDAAMATVNIEPGLDKAAMARIYAEMLATRPVDKAVAGTGDLSTWPAQWTRDSLGAARGAYDGITVASKEKVRLRNDYGRTVSGYSIQLSDGYAEKMGPVAERQLRLAGERLARVLDTIWP